MVFGRQSYFKMRHAALTVIAIIALFIMYELASGKRNTNASHLDYVGINLSGAEYPSEHMKRWGTEEVYPDQRVITYFADLQMNIIRLPLNWRRLQPVAFEPLAPEALAKIDAVVDLATQRRQTVILDLHEFGYAYDELIVGDNKAAQSLVDFWTRFATHYRDRPNVILGIMNEPHAQHAADWLPALNKSVAAIRSAGSRQILLLSGSYWDDAGNWTTTDNSVEVGDKIVDPDNNYIIELHYYFNPWTPGGRTWALSVSQGREAFAKVTRWARSRKVRLFLGEIGVSSDQTSLAALDDTLDFMEENGDVWAGVTYWAFGGGKAPFSVFIDQPEPSAQMQIMMHHLPPKAHLQQPKQ